MKKMLLFATLVLSFGFVACEKEKKDDDIPKDFPRTTVPAELRGLFMYGQFSTTEYWSRNPSTYIGNGFSMAIAFRFNENGTYEQYFTASTVVAGATTYQQSLSKGTVEIDPATQTIVTHPYKSHYKRTRLGKTEEERDWRRDELKDDTYTYTISTEANGSKVLHMKFKDSVNPPIKFYLKG